MEERKRFHDLSIVIVFLTYVNRIENLLPPSNVCKTFEGYYTNKDCYYNPDQILEVPDIVKRYNYSLEEFEINTDDGYILKVFRIPNKNPNSKPVLLQHAILASSVNFLITGNSSLGFVLADEGYDVWLGNFRGTKYSDRHKYLKRTDETYWNFRYDSDGYNFALNDGCKNFDELGTYDIPSTIDLVHKTTNKSMIYIGYSLGAVAGHVYSSIYPQEAAEKLEIMISMAPATMIETSRSILRFFRPYWNTLQRLVNTHNHGELFSHNGPLVRYIRSVCFPYPHQLKMCLGFIQLAFGINEDQINPETLPVTLYHDGDSISIKTVIHLSQIAISRKFRKFDYGRDINMKVYNDSFPPSYNLSAIKVPNHLIYGKGDFVAGEKAVSDLYEQFSKRDKKYGIYAVEDPNFAHTDFIIGKDVKQLVYDHILRFLKKIERDNKLT